MCLPSVPLLGVAGQWEGVAMLTSLHSLNPLRPDPEPPLSGAVCKYLPVVCQRR